MDPPAPRERDAAGAGDRRAFLRSSAGLASAALLSTPPWLATGCSEAPQPVAATPGPIATPPEPVSYDGPEGDALQPMRRYLESYRPPRSSWPAGGRAVLRYEVVGWTRPPGQVGGGSALGSLTLDLTRGEDGGRMVVVRERTVNYATAHFRAEVAFSDARSLRPSRWETWEHTIRDGEVEGGLRFGESGRASEREVSWSSGGVVELREEVEFEPVCAWSLPFALAREGIDGVPRRFTLLRDLWSLQPRSGVGAAGGFRALLGGEEVPLESFLVLGEGVTPTHVLIDPDRRPLLITGGLESLALVSIEAG